MAIGKIQNRVAFTHRLPQENQNSAPSMERLLLPSLHYNNCEDIPDTVNMIRPEAGQGRLLSNDPISSLGRFFKNRYYDLKAVYKGYNGTANDHQLGRTNDVGMLLGGLGIAAFLTTKRLTALPKRMEYVGLASFFTSMALWPKIGVFGPAKLIHGFDVDKRYVDDQGRNKSVFQDPNYVPFDLYRGDKKSEDLSVIADRMGISKNVKNREEMAKDQMRKISVQNHTLWMWSSGLAVPTMTALLCNGFERIYEPFLAKSQAKNARLGLDVAHAVIANNGNFATTLNPKETQQATSLMNKMISQIQDYDIVKNEINKFTKLPKDHASKIVTETEVTKFINNMLKDAGKGVSSAFAKDITSMLDMGGNVVADAEFVKQLATNIEKNLYAHPHLKNAIVSADEISTIVKNISQEHSVVNKTKLLEEIENLGKQKIASYAKDGSANILQRRFTEKITAELLPKSEKLILNNDSINKIKSLEAPLTSYIAKFKCIAEANKLQLGDIADSQNAYHWKNLEKTFADTVYKNTPFTKLAGLMDNEKAVQTIMEKRFAEIAADPKEFEQVIKSISDAKMSYLQTMLGSGKEGEYISLITGENPNGGVNWNRRTFAANGTQMDKFIEAQGRIAEDLKNSLEKPEFNGQFKHLKEKIFGFDFKTSVAGNEVYKNVSKVEDFVTVCDRLIHSLDVYRRAHLYKTKTDLNVLGDGGKHINHDWIIELFEKAKKETIAANSSDFYAKFGTHNKVRVFQSYMNLIYAPEPGTYADSLFGRGYLTKETENIMGETSSLTTKHWINKFRNLLGDDIKNWFYAEFKAGDAGSIDNRLKTPHSRYKTQGKSLVKLAEQGAKQAHNSGKWMRVFGGLFVGVLSGSILAQVFFGKKDNTIPLEKHKDHYHIRRSNNTEPERMEAKRAH